MKRSDYVSFPSMLFGSHLLLIKIYCFCRKRRTFCVGASSCLLVKTITLSSAAFSILIYTSLLDTEKLSLISRNPLYIPEMLFHNVSSPLCSIPNQNPSINLINNIKNSNTKQFKSNKLYMLHIYNVCCLWILNINVKMSGNNRRMLEIAKFIN